MVDSLGLSVIGVTLAIGQRSWAVVKRWLTSIMAYLAQDHRHLAMQEVETSYRQFPEDARQDGWHVLGPSLRGAGCTKFTRFLTRETGVSLVGMASCMGVDGSNAAPTQVDVRVYADLDHKLLLVEIAALLSSDDCVVARKSRVSVDGGNAVLEWTWRSTETDPHVAGRLWAGCGYAFNNQLLDRLKATAKLPAASSKITFRYEDTHRYNNAEDVMHTAVEATGKGLYEACMWLVQRLQSSLANRHR